MLNPQACSAAGAGVGDLDQLYRALSRRLEQIVRLDVRAPDPVIEDACQFAWGRLVQHAHRVNRESALAWLARTAVREAMKLSRRERRELSLDAILELTPESSLRSGMLGPAELAEHRERIAGLRDLPERQRQLIWLAALGLSYPEMASETGWSVRTVERQLLRGRRTLRVREEPLMLRSS